MIASRRALLACLLPIGIATGGIMGTPPQGHDGIYQTRITTMDSSGQVATLPGFVILVKG